MLLSQDSLLLTLCTTFSSVVTVVCHTWLPARSYEQPLALLQRPAVSSSSYAEHLQLF